MNPDWFLDETLSNVVLCTICRCIAKDAVSHPCDHLACAECTKHWSDMNSTNGKQCHVCRQVYPKEAQPLAMARRLVQQLRMRCPLGCKWEGDVGGWTKHQIVCSEAFRPCDLCHLLVKNNDRATHTQSCPKRSIKCVRCFETFPFDLAQTHLCPQQALPCSHCGLSVIRQNLPHHETSECPRPCGICGVLCVQEALASHVENECLRPCSRQCGDQLRGTKAEHEHRQRCTKEVVECPYQRFGCLFKRTREEADQHIASDAKRHANMLQAECKSSDADKVNLMQAERKSSAVDTVTLPMEIFFKVLQNDDDKIPAVCSVAESILSQGSLPHKQHLMFVACHIGAETILQRLIEAKCDLDAVNEQGRRPVDCALYPSNMRCAELLVMAGCSMTHDWAEFCYASEKETVRAWLARRG